MALDGFAIPFGRKDLTVERDIAGAQDLRLHRWRGRRRQHGLQGIGGLNRRDGRRRACRRRQGDALSCAPWANAACAKPKVNPSVNAIRIRAPFDRES